MILLECPTLGIAAAAVVVAFDSAMSMARCGFEAIIDVFVSAYPTHLALSTTWRNHPPPCGLMEVLQREHSEDAHIQHTIDVVYAKLHLCAVCGTFQQCVEEACLSPTGVPCTPSAAHVEAMAVVLQALREHLLNAHTLVVAADSSQYPSPENLTNGFVSPRAPKFAPIVHDPAGDSAGLPVHGSSTM